MIGILSFFLILAVIGIVVGAIWIWKNKNFMKVKALLISLALALVIGFGMLILVTEMLQPTIEFSLFLGIPSGIVSGVIIFVIAYWWLGKKQD